MPHDQPHDQIGFKVDVDPHDSNLPTAKVTVMISDTTALMPAMAQALDTSKLCKGMQWAPCMAYVANLLLLDQLKVPAIASLLAHAKQIAKVLRADNFCSVFCCALALFSA
jgi:NADPH-dependent ferric siderophore reductase